MNNDNKEIHESILDIEENKGKNKKEKKAMTKVEKIFNIASAIFILGFACFYGYRLIHYYRVYNPKAENGESITTLSSHVLSSSPIVYEGEGLYNVNASYIYKGVNVKNYVVFNNMLWRIVKINADRSVQIVLDDAITSLRYDSETKDFVNSNIFSYLNEEFIKNLDTSLLTYTAICLEKVNDLDAFSCKKTNNEAFVSLLNVSDYLNSLDENSYLVDNTDTWLSSVADDAVWNINKANLSKSSVDSLYGVKPVVTLKNSVALLSGDGSSENPYKVSENNKSYLASYIKLGEDTYQVYEDGENLKLISAGLYKDGLVKMAFSNSQDVYNLEEDGSLAYYLNNDYYNSLEYKDLLVKCSWNIGEYTSDYNTVDDKKVDAYIGLYSITDIIFNNNINNYYLLTTNGDNKTYFENSGIFESNSALVRPIRPAVCIKKSVITGGSGSISDPYRVEV